MDYAELRLQGHPRLELLALPVLGEIRDRLDQPRLAVRSQQHFFVPQPPAQETSNPITATTTSADTQVLGKVVRVGPNEAILSIAQATKIAKDGDIVEIQAGIYHADVALWNQKKLTIRGIGGTARIFADGKIAEGKAIWVIRNGDFDIENIDFIGARASDKNGAGIRFENGRLHLKNCLFFDNQTGFLAGGEGGIVEIENSEFAYNGAGDGQSHNLYVGTIQSLKITGSYFHHANVGHLVKSRAKNNYIAYNRISDEDGGKASYEIDFPNGGNATVIGNIIQQNRNTENSTIIAYGEEGYKWPENRLSLASNTIVNDHPYGGAFLRVSPGAQSVVSTNNLFIGMGKLHTPPDILHVTNDIHAGWEIFALAARQDYSLNQDGQKLEYKSQGLSFGGISLTPKYEYASKRKTRPLSREPIFPGALQTTEN